MKRGDVKSGRCFRKAVARSSSTCPLVVPLAVAGMALVEVDVDVSHSPDEESFLSTSCTVVVLLISAVDISNSLNDQSPPCRRRQSRRR